MSTIASTPPRVPSPLYRMSLEQYESLIASGFFTKHDDVHLINGIVVNRMAESALDGAICDLIRLAVEVFLVGAWGAWHTRGDKGLRIPARTSIPRPDLAVVRGTPRDYLKRYPDAADAAFVAEVSLSSLNEDRAMADIYAAGGVPVHWIVNVDDGQVEVYSDPGPGGYRSRQVLAPGHVLSVVIDGVAIGEIPVADILP